MRGIAGMVVVVLALGAVPARADEVAQLATQALSGEMTPRRKALKALVAMGTAPALEAVLAAGIAADKRGDTVGVNDVSYTLKSVNSPAAAPALRAALPRVPAGMKPAVVAALGRLGDVESAGALRELARQQEDKRVAREAYLALAAVTTEASDLDRIIADLADRKTESSAVEALRHLGQPVLAPRLVPLLRDAAISQQAVLAAVKALGHMAAPEAAVPLMDVVERDERGAVRAAAGEALVIVSEPAQVPRLEKLLVEKKRGEVRDAYLAADRRQGWASLLKLLKTQPATAANLLYQVAPHAHPSDEKLAMAALGSADDSVRRGGIEILGHLDSASAEAALCRELRNAKNKSFVREDAAAGLGSFKTDGAITCLVDTMQGEKTAPEEWRRKFFGNNTWEACIRALRAITGESLGEDPAAWRTWHEGGLKAGVAGMTAGLSHKDAAVRALAANRLLVNKERAKATDALITALGSERDAAARLGMIRALGAIRDPRARDVLVAVLEQRGRRDLDEHVALGRALDDLGDGRGTAALVDLLGSDNAEERATAARALSQVTGEPEHQDPARWRAWWKTYSERYRK